MGVCSSKQDNIDVGQDRPTKPLHDSGFTAALPRSKKPIGSIAVFGSFDSGKSTLVRKLWLLYGESYSQAERQNFRKAIDPTILDGTLTLLHAFLELHPPVAIPTVVQTVAPLIPLNLSYGGNAIIEESNSISPMGSNDNNNIKFFAPNDNTNQPQLNIDSIAPQTPPNNASNPTMTIPEDLILAQNDDNIPQTHQTRPTSHSISSSSSHSNVSTFSIYGNNQSNQQTLLQQTLAQPVSFFYDHPQHLTTYPNPTNELLAAIYALLQLENDLFQSTAPYGVIHPFINRAPGSNNGVLTPGTPGAGSYDQRPSFLTKSFVQAGSTTPNGNNSNVTPPLSPFVLLQRHPITTTLAQHVITLWKHPVFRYLYQHSHMLYKATPIINSTVHINNNNNNLVVFCEGYLKRLIALQTPSSTENTSQTASTIEDIEPVLPDQFRTRRASVVKGLQKQIKKENELVQDIDLLLMKTSHYRCVNASHQQQDDGVAATDDEKKQDEGNVKLYNDLEQSSHCMDDENDIPINSNNNNTNAVSPMINFQFEPYDRYLFETSGFAEVQDFFVQDLIQQENNYVQTIRNTKDFNTPFSDVFRKFILEQKKVQDKTSSSPHISPEVSKNASIPNSLSNLDENKMSGSGNAVGGINNGNNPVVTEDNTNDLQQAILRTGSTLGPEYYLPSELYHLDDMEEPLAVVRDGEYNSGVNKGLKQISEDAALNMSNSDQPIPATPTKSRGSISFRAVMSPRSGQDRGTSVARPSQSGQHSAIEVSPSQNNRVLRPSSAQAGKQDSQQPLLKQPAFFTSIEENNDSNGSAQAPPSTPSDTTSNTSNNSSNSNTTNTTTTTTTTAVVNNDPTLTTTAQENNNNNNNNNTITQQNEDKSTTTNTTTAKPPTPNLSTTSPAAAQAAQPTTPPQPSAENSQTALSIFDCAGNSRGQSEWNLVMKNDVQLIYYLVSLTEFLNASSSNHYGFMADVIQNRTGRGLSCSDITSEGDSMNAHSSNNIIGTKRSFGSPMSTNSSLNDNNQVPGSPAFGNGQNGSFNVSGTGGALNKYFTKPENINRHVRKNIMLFTKTINSHSMNRDTEIVVVFSKYDLLAKHLYHQKQWFQQQEAIKKQQEAANMPDSTNTTNPDTTTQSQHPFANTISSLPQDRPHLILFNEIFKDYQGDNFDPHEITQFLVNQYMAKLILQDKDVHVVAPQSGLVYLQNRNSAQSDLTLSNLNHIESVLSQYEKVEEKPQKVRRKTIFTFDLDAQDEPLDPNALAEAQQQAAAAEAAAKEQQAKEAAANAVNNNNNDDEKNGDEKTSKITEQQKALLKQEILIRDTFDCSVLYLEPISRLLDRNQQDE